MGFILWIILGAVAGYLASLFMKTNAEQGFLGDMVLGIIGALLGGFVFNLFGASGTTGFNLWSLLVATVGAVIVLAIKKALVKA